MTDVTPYMPHAHAAELAGQFIARVDDYFNWLASYDLLRQTTSLLQRGGDTPTQLKVVRMKQIQARTDLLDTGRALTEALTGIRHNTERFRALLDAVDEGVTGIVRAAWPSVRAELEALQEASEPDEGTQG